MRGPYSEDAATFAAVAHDDGQMDLFYSLLADQMILWAEHMPRGTDPEEARAYMRACSEAFIARVRAETELLFAAEVATIPWGLALERAE